MQHDAIQFIAQVKSVSKSFGQKLALDKVDLDIKPSQVLAILGSNGAGKTTLINILLGRLALDTGQVSVFGAEAGSMAARCQAGAMLQVAGLPEALKVKEHIQLFRSYYPEPMAYQKILAYAGLESLQDRYSKKLSGGEKQRLLFALSICGNPKLLFLDEPSVGMDVSARKRLWSAIRDLKVAGTAIVLTTHYLEEADALADEMVILKQGKITHRGSSETIKACVTATTIKFVTPEHAINIAGLPGVVSLENNGKYSQIQTNQVNQTLLALLTLAPEVQDLTVNQAGLEQAFLQLDKGQ